MAKFSKFPPEVIIDIWRHVLPPEDIESFVSVPKQTYVCAKTFLQQHKLLKSKYETIRDDIRPGCSNVYYRLLKEVIIEPHIGLYVKKICVGYLRRKWEDPVLGYTEDGDPILTGHTPHTRLSSDDMKLIREAVLSSNLPGPSWNRSGPLESAIENGKEESVLSFLLTMLPSVKTIRFLRTVSVYDIFLDIKVFQVHDVSVLPHLRCVGLGDNGTEFFDSNTIMEPFVSLPSLETIRCSSVADRDHENVINARRSALRYTIPPWILKHHSPRIHRMPSHCARSILLCGRHQGAQEFQIPQLILKYVSDFSWIRSILLVHASHSSEH